MVAGTQFSGSIYGLVFLLIQRLWKDAQPVKILLSNNTRSPYRNLFTHR